MIEQLPFNLTLSDEHFTILEGKKPWTGSQWRDDDIIPVKNEIRRQLEDNQDCCAYYGLPFKSSKDKQIEHIAAKANYRHPQFTFTLQNLVLSCGYCNDLIVKGAKETIELPAAINYEDCIFLLVHPYFDNPDEHYEWVEDNNSEKVLIQIRNESPKAKFSIDLFDLASSGMSQLRACAAFRRRRYAEMPITEQDETLIQQTMNYRE